MRRAFGLLIGAVASVGCQLVLGIEERSAREPGDAAVESDASDAGADRGTFPIVHHVDAGPERVDWPGCDPLAPFESMTLLAEIDTSAAETSARLTPDQMTLFFSRAPVAFDYGDLYVATRASLSDPFSDIKVLTPPSTPGTPGDHDPFVTADGLRLWFDSYALGRRSIFLAQRTSSKDAWNAGGHIDMGTGFEEYEPYATGDGHVLYFTSAFPAPGDDPNANILRAWFTGDLLLSVELASDIDTFGGERAPVVSEDDRVIYFASTRRSRYDYDVYVATRRTAGDPFGPPTLVAEVSSSSFDFPTWVSPDLCTLYVKSLRSGKGADDIWVAKRTKKR